MTLDDTEAPQVKTFGTRPLGPDGKPHPPLDLNGPTYGPPPQVPSRKSRRRGLGRGLDTLIPGSSDSSGGQTHAPIGSISANPSQPRQRFDQDELEELASSIKEHGILQPLLVRSDDMGGYELIAGERRWRAAGIAGVETVPIVVQDAASEDDEERLTLALVENVQRTDLNPIELASAFEQLSEAGWTQEKIAEQVGKSRTSVANLLRLLRLPDSVQAMIAAGSLSEGHGRAMLPAPMSERASLAKRAQERGWTVRQLEEAVRRLSEPSPERSNRTVEPTPLMLGAVRRLEAALGTKVEVRVGGKGPSDGGRIVVHWYDEEQLDALASRISGASTDDEVDVDSFGV